MDRANRSKTWEDYGITKYRYAELKAFCLQYDEKKSRISYIPTTPVQDGQPKAAQTGSQTERMAIENAVNIRDCEMIEQAATMAAPDIYPYILKSVTNDLSYRYVEYDVELGRIPCGRSDFYAYRKLFYHFLDNLKRGDKMQ